MTNEFLESILFYGFLAISFESVAQYIWELRKWREKIPAYIALAIAMGAAFTLHLDIFRVLGLGDIPYTWVTVLLTGFATGRGASFFHDLQGWVQNKYQKAKVGTAVAEEVANAIEGQ